MPIEIKNEDTQSVPNRNKDSFSTNNVSLDHLKKDESNIDNHPFETENCENSAIDLSSNTAINSTPKPAPVSDPNKITVSISDNTTPIVVLYGPPACGKTMTLVRLTRFLKDIGYTITPDKVFRGSEDPKYKELCDDFDEIIASNDAALSTDRISFMLVKVFFNGHPICQILEAPGEHYYNPDTKETNYPPYISRIISQNNRKIWGIMVEPDWESDSFRRGYVNNIKKLKLKTAHRNDGFLFIYNKIDRTNAIHISDAIKEVSDQFAGIFVPFENQNPITKLWRKYNCDFVTFTTGDYCEAADGTLTYTPSADEYPQRLWNCIMKHIKG